MYEYIHMHIRAINEKRGRGFEKEQGRVYGRGRKGGRNDVSTL